jgi:hypothetical protein
MIRKVCEVDPLICLKCGGGIKVIAFLPDWPAVDGIIDNLKLTFIAEKPPWSRSRRPKGAGTISKGR